MNSAITQQGHYQKGDDLFTISKAASFFSLIVLLCEYVMEAFNNSSHLTNIYLIQLGVVFAITYAATVIKLGWTHIFSLLQFTTFVFMVSTPLLSPFADGETIRIAYSPAREEFSEEIVQRTLLIFSTYIVVSFLAYFNILAKKRIVPKVTFNVHTKDMYFVIGKWCLILMLPFALSYTMFLMTVSRADLYSSGTESLGLPLYIRVTNMIYTAGYYLIVASRPSYKQFSKYTLIYFVSLIPTLLSGERGEVLLVVVFYIWYITAIYQKKIKWFIIAILGILGVVSSYVISLTRQDLGLENDSLFKIILTFFSESSTTFKLSAFFVEYRDAVPHSMPFFLDQALYGIESFLFGLPSAGQSMEMLAARSSLGHNLVYHINSDYYLGGNSMGTAWVAECYEFGIVGVMLGAILLSVFVRFFENKVLNSRYLSILTYMFFELIIMSPRGNLLPSLYGVIKWFLVVSLLVAIYKIANTRNKTA